MKKGKSVLDIFNVPIWLFVLLLTVFVLRIPSFFEPYSYGDEMIYLTLGEAVRQGVPLYKGIYDNKPPLLYLIAFISGNLFWFKAILALWHLITVFIFFKLTEFLFLGKKNSQLIATTIFALFTTLPLLEGNIVNAELFMILPTIAAFYILLTKTPSSKNLVFSGVLFSIATLFKIPAAFDLAAIVFFWLISAKKLNKKNLKKISLSIFYLSAGFITPILLTFIWYFLKGALTEYLFAAFFQNIGYLSSWRPVGSQEPFFLKNAPLFTRALIVLLLLSALYWKKKVVSPNFSFICAWLFFSLFAVTLSERPYPHYLIQSVAPISLLSSILFTFTNLEQVLAIMPLTIAVFAPFYFKFWYYPTLPYYIRFAKFISKNISQEEYFSNYASHIPRNYKIATFLKSSSQPDEKIFVWGDTSNIYALSQRLPPVKYVADYHIKDFSNEEETIKALRSNPPSFIIILPDASPFPQLNNFLISNYGLVETIDSAKIWKLLNSQVRSLLTS